MQLLGPAFGLGTDGQLNITTDTTDVPINSTAVGAATSNEITATNASFATGQLIMTYQMAGTNAGNWELNRIASYVGGTITTLLPLANTYANSGNDYAQVTVVKEYTGIDVSSGKTLTSSAFSTVGGILPLACSGLANIVGNISAAGKGFRFGNGGSGPSADNGLTGLGENGTASSETSSANATGGGGGDNDQGDGGGGGGHVNAGSSGGGGASGGTASAKDSEALTTAVMGGGGGGGGNWDAQSGAGRGGQGGGFIVLFTNSIQVTGGISVNGEDGQTGSKAATKSGGGGGGAGGSILIKSTSADLGSNLLSSSAGAGGTGNYNGGAGSIGRIRVETCSEIVGTTSQGSLSTSVGGFDYCGSLASIIA